MKNSVASRFAGLIARSAIYCLSDLLAPPPALNGREEEMPREAGHHIFIRGGESEGFMRNSGIIKVEFL